MKVKKMSGREWKNIANHIKNNLEIAEIQRITVRYKEKVFMKRGQDLLY